MLVFCVKYQHQRKDYKLVFAATRQKFKALIFSNFIFRVCQKVSEFFRIEITHAFLVKDDFAIGIDHKGSGDGLAL
jgi:hypothetical protein